ncbi:MAG: hypothetical protein ABSH48_17045, partial [Verrucomicrobiota bacterium]
MNSTPSAPSAAKSQKTREPFDVVKVGSVSVPIYANINIIPQRDPQTGAIIYESLPEGATSKPKALVKYQSTSYTLAYYEGTKRVRQKFSDLAKAQREAGLIAVKLANFEGEALKLKGTDRADYIRAMQILREWKPDANLHLVVTDYVAGVRRLPENVGLGEVVEYFVKRHPIGLPAKTVRDVVNELIDSKTSAGKSDVYIKDLTGRLGTFADKFNVRISNV